MFLKWFLQIGAMFSDLLIIGFSIGLIYGCIQTKSLLLWCIAIFALLMTYGIWKEQGGFIAWRKGSWKNLNEGWDKIKAEGRRVR